MYIRLMMVTTSLDKIHPKILFTGSELECFGFPVEMLVSVFYEEDVLIMTACGTGLSAYRKVVCEVRERQGQLLQVFLFTRKKRMPNLELEGDWLVKQGFAIGDLLLVSFEPGCIRIKRLDLAALGFTPSPSAAYRLLNVYKKSIGCGINISGGYLEDYGFLPGMAARLTHKRNQIFFHSPKPYGKRIQCQPIPNKVNIFCKRKVPFLCVSGRWLLERGFAPGDPLILQCQPGKLHLLRLNADQLDF